MPRHQVSCVVYIFISKPSTDMKIKLNIDLKKDDEYTIPIIKTSGNRTYIEFYFNGVRYRPTFELNRIKNQKEKEKEFIRVRSRIEQLLHEGWNPEEDVVEDTIEETKTEFRHALEFAYEKLKKGKRETTLNNYKTFYNTILKSSKFGILGQLYVTDIKRRDIIDILESLQEENGLTDIMRNRVLKLIKQLFDKMVEYEICEHNVADKIKLIKEDKPVIQIPTNEEVNMIKDHLKNKMPNLWDYVFFLFQTGIRPNEISNLQLKMIDIKKRVITIPKEISKTNKERKAPIDQPVYEWLLTKQIDKYDREFYLFGSGRTERYKHLKMGENDISISALRLKRFSVTDAWKRLVKDELGINVNMYSFKHLRANKEFMLTNDLSQAKVLFGHSKVETTQIYANQQNEIMLEKLKKNNMSLNNIN